MQSEQRARFAGFMKDFFFLPTEKVLIVVKKEKNKSAVGWLQKETEFEALNFE